MHFAFGSKIQVDIRNPTLAPSELNASPVYLTAAAINSAISNSDLETVNKSANQIFVIVQIPLRLGVASPATHERDDN